MLDGTHGKISRRARNCAPGPISCMSRAFCLLNLAPVTCHATPLLKRPRAARRPPRFHSDGHAKQSCFVVGNLYRHERCQPSRVLSERSAQRHRSRTIFFSGRHRHHVMTHRTPSASFIADFDRIWSAGLGPSDARDTVSTADDDLLQEGWTLDTWA